MKNVNPIRTLTAVMSLVASAFIVGCQHDKLAHGEDFYKDNQTTFVGNLSKAQCSAGAKSDGMLYDDHFHGGDLNSLGEVKLDLIVKDTPAGDPIYIYLSMPHDRVAERQSTVTAYLKAAGVTDTKIIVAEGPNTNPSTPTAYNLGGLYKSDGTSYTGQAAADTEAGAGGMAGGGSH